jgi:hypothetical protein
MVVIVVVVEVIVIVAVVVVVVVVDDKTFKSNIIYNYTLMIFFTWQGKHISKKVKVKFSRYGPEQFLGALGDPEVKDPDFLDCRH